LKRLLISLLVTILLLSTFPVLTHSQTTQQDLPRLEESQCAFEVEARMEFGPEVACYKLVVPETRDRPTDKTIKVAVAVIRSLSPSPQPDPLFILQGGPGGSSVDSFAIPS
jgi:hypothetical protein